MADVTVGPTGRDYPSLNSAVAGEQGDLSTIGPLNFLCDAFTDTTEVLIDSYTNPSATNRIYVGPASGAEHGGVNSAGYILQCSGTFSKALENKISHTRINGITVTRTTNGRGIVETLSSGDAGGCVYSNNFMNGASTTDTESAGFTCSSAGTQTTYLKVYNNVIEGFYYGIYHTTFRRADAYNNTCVGNKYGVYLINSNNPTNYKNNVCYGSVTADWFETGTTNGTFDYNRSGDGTTPGTNTGSSVVSGDFVDYAGGDYQPSAGGELAGTGTDLSSLFTDDITGAAR